MAAIILKYLAAFSLGLAFASTDLCAQTIYRCGAPGQVILTDQPCDGSRAPLPGHAAANAGSNSAADATRQPPADPVGAWRGTAQVLLNVSDKAVSIASPNSLSLSIDAHGILTGALQEQNCRLSGTLTSDYGSSDRAVLVKLSNCHEQRLNLSYTGTLSMAPAGHPSRLAVSGFGGFLGGGAPTTASLSVDLKRDASAVAPVLH